MPFGLQDPKLGMIAFGAVKFLGYSFFGRQLIVDLEKGGDVEPARPPRSRLAVRSIGIGIARTCIGLAVGGMWWHATRRLEENTSLIFYLGLVPLRFAEWWLLFWLLFRPALRRRLLGWIDASWGVVISFALDLPAALGLVATAGWWIC
jgi:hypothetical protein